MRSVGRSKINSVAESKPARADGLKAEKKPPAESVKPAARSKRKRKGA